jgi:tellurite resistance protein
MFERFRSAHGALHDVQAEDDEHLAALEVMLLVALVDRSIKTDELDRVHEEVESGGWESDTFNYEGKFGPAMAAVRGVDPGSVDAFLAACLGRIHSDELRDGLRAACRAVANADGQIGPEESELLSKIEAQLP